MYAISLLEQENKRKGMRISVIFHGVLIAILMVGFMFCEHTPQKAADNQYSIAVNFQEIEFTRETSSNSTKAKAASGKPKPKQDPITEIKKNKVDQIEVKKPTKPIPKPTKPIPKPSTPVVSEIVVEEETDVVAVEEEIEFEEPELEPEPIPEPEPEPVKEPVETTNNKPQNTSKGKENSSDSEKQGTSPSTTNGPADGTGKGGNGDGPGRDAGGNDGDSGSGDGGIGTGEFDGSGNGVFGRKVIYRDIAAVLKAGFENQSGKKIVIDYCVNRLGLVTYAEINFDQTTAIVNNSQLKVVLKGISKYKVEPDPSAPKEQCGKMSIVLQEINALH